MALGLNTATTHWRSVVAAFIYLTTSFVVWMLPGVLGVSIATAFSLGHGARALAVAVPLLGGALLRIPLGLAADRFGCKRVGLVCHVLTVPPLLWLWLRADSILDVYGAGLFLGVAGASFAVALTLASRSSLPEHQGLATGIAGAGNAGTALAALAAPRLAEAFGWREVFGFAVIPVLLSCFLFARLAEETPPQPVTWRRYGELLRQSELWCFNLFYGFTFGVFVGLSTLLALFLNDQYRLPPVTCGYVTAGGVLLASLARPLGGMLGDRWGGLYVLVSAITLGGALLLAMSLSPSLPLAVLTLIALLAVLGLGNGAVFQIVPQWFKSEVGAATGIVGAAGGLLGFGLAWLLGSLREMTGSYAPGFTCLALLALACLGALAVLAPIWRDHPSGPVPAAVMEEQS